MTPIKSYFNAKQIFEAMRQRWWYFVINFIALFFAHPVAYLLELDLLTRVRPSAVQYGADSTYLLQVMNFAKRFFSMSADMIPVLIVMVFASALTSIVMFSYLHNRKEIYFFHSLPIRRESLWAANFIAGAASFILPLLANVLIAVGCAAATGTLGYISAGGYVTAILQVILFFFVNYAIALVSAGLAGTVFSHLCGVIVLNFCVFFTFMVHFTLSSIFFTTFVQDSLGKALIRLAPYVRSFSVIAEPMTLLEGILYLLLTLLLIALCLWLYQRRPSEKSTVPLIFDGTKPVFKYLVVLWGTAYMGLFFYSISGVPFMIFGFIAGGFLTHMACEVVFQKDFKSMMKNKLGLLIFLIAFGAVFSVYYYDITGFDAYVPNGAKVQSIEFTDSLGDRYYYPGQEEKKPEAYTAPEERAAILDIARLAVDYNAQNRSTDAKGRVRTENITLSPKYTANSVTLTVSYRLQSGRVVQRRYSSIPLVAIREPFEMLYNTPRHIQNSSYLFSLEDAKGLSRVEVVSAINQSEARYFERKTNSLSDEAVERLLTAMRNDLTKRTFADLQKYRQVFVVRAGIEVLNDSGQTTYYTNIEIPVYENDAETLAVLQGEFGMKDPKETYEVLLASVDRIELYRTDKNYDIAYAEKLGIPVSTPDATITDPARIKEFMDFSVITGRFRSSAALVDGSLNAVLIMKSDAAPEAKTYYDYYDRGNEGGQNEYRIDLQVRLDQLPASVEALLNR